MALLPIRTRYSGPAPIETCKKSSSEKSFVHFVFLATDKEDIIDEAIKFFRANIFFRNYEMKVKR